MTSSPESESLPELPIRPFRDEPVDRAGLVEVVSPAFIYDRWKNDPQFEGVELGSLFADGALEMALSSVAHPETHFAFLAWKGSRVVGSALGQLEERLEAFTGIRVATLWSLAVLPEARRLGVASALFRRAQAWAQGRGAHQLTVSTDGPNPANELYRKLGGVQVHTLNTWSFPLEVPRP